MTKVVSSLAFNQTPLQDRVNLLSSMCRIFKILECRGSPYIADYGLQQTKLMRTLSRRTVQAIDGVEDTQPNANGISPELIMSAGFSDLRETKIFPTTTGSISIYFAKKNGA